MIKSFRTYFYLFFALILLLANWNLQHEPKAEAQSIIPKQAIRLRILANSDHFRDQMIKRKVRDAVVQEVDGWVGGLRNVKQARVAIRAHMSQLSQTTGKVLSKYGADYGFQINYGIVSFPAKMYGNKVYPAGRYEALRITLGSGIGQNWWCVLFPPLCFVNVVSGDAVSPQSSKNAVRSSGRSIQQPLSAKPKPAPAVSASPDASMHSLAKQHVRFYFWDMLKNLVHKVSTLFS